MRFTFSQLKGEIQSALKDMGFERPTPVQAVAIPLALEGRDLLIQARTGTGKTGAFALPILESIKPGEKALILAPTRELALQIRDHMRDMGKFLGLMILALYGGTPVMKDVWILSTADPDVIVGTPGRIRDLISRGSLKIDGIRYLVLDEVDLMLDLGFREEIEWIVSKVPRSRQTFMVSATVPDGIKEIAARYLKGDFHRVSVEELKPRVREIVIRIKSEDQKIGELTRILKENGDERVMVFVRTRRSAKGLASTLKRSGFNAAPLHGDMPQRKRESVMRAFRQGEVSVLVATDVASRGLDIDGVSLVVNYHIPEDPKVYIHRIGRTGRLGREGTAINLVSPSERANLFRIERLKRGFTGSRLRT
ncbi:MAG: DEAD/DEAH box helicase [Aquificota bacterium]|nr:DEAD/DEAH box helicase [Aquificota bacterium]